MRTFKHEGYDLIWSAVNERYSSGASGWWLIHKAGAYVKSVQGTLEQARTECPAE